MANPATGATSELRYGWETSYASEQGTKDKVFGHGTKIVTLTRNNNLESVFNVGQRNAQALAEKQFGGSLSVEFILANPWWLRAVLGAAPSTTGAGPYTHTYSESNTIVSMSIENEITSDTASVTAFLGCKVNTCVITAAVGELVKVRLDMIYANEAEDTSVAADVEESFALFSFAFATLEFPNGSTINDIQTVEITINNNAEMVYGLGSRIGQQLPVKNRSYTARISRTFEDAATFLEAFYGLGTGPDTIVEETATMEVNFDNGLTTTNQRKFAFLFTGVKIDEHNMPQDSAELVIEDLSLIMRDLTSVIVTNNTSAAA